MSHFGRGAWFMIRNKVLESNIIGIGSNKDERKALDDAVFYLPWEMENSRKARFGRQ
jgi:hypothetical protein